MLSTQWIPGTLPCPRPTILNDYFWRFYKSKTRFRQVVLTFEWAVSDSTFALKSHIFDHQQGNKDTLTGKIRNRASTAETLSERIRTTELVARQGHGHF